MFGDLDLWKDAAFFEQNADGLLILPDRTYGLEISACLLVPSSEKAIFEPQQWRSDVRGLLDYAGSHAMHLRQATLERLRGAAETPQILAMSTCAFEFTDARTVLLAVMEPMFI